MSIEEKKAAVADLSERLRDADVLYLTDFTGLDVGSMTTLRANLREQGVEYRVVKNTLARRAMGGLDLPEVDEAFSGPTGLVIGTEDPVAPAKVLREFAEDHEERPSVKVGIVDRRTVSPEEVERLAQLPSREELMTELVGAFEAPLREVAFLMQGMLQEFAGLIEALRNERENT